MVRFTIKRILCLVLLAACLLSLAAADPLPTPSVVPSIDPNAGVRATPTPTPTPQPIPNVLIPGWGSIAFDGRADEILIDLYNPEANADWYYLTFSLYIVKETVNEKTGETEKTYEEVFHTGLVPPGLAVNSIKLDHEIEPGVYNAYMFVQPYFMKDITPVNSAGFSLTLTIYGADFTPIPR